MTRRLPIPRLVFTRRAAGTTRRGDGPDRPRFHSLVLPHLDAAWNYARYLTRDVDIAEDIVQDAFLRAIHAEANCRGDGKAWLMTIVRHCWHDWLKRNRPQAIIGGDSDEAVDADTPHSLLERQSEARHLRDVIAMLPEPFREALVLRDLEELTYREIAEVTHAPMGTVMSRIARAREMLAALVLDGEERVLAGRRAS